MPCFHPLSAYRSRAGRDPNTGSWPIVFNVREGYIDMPVQVPCGQCIGCRLERSRQWAIRCMHESSLHEDNCFLTLTYDNAHLPADGSLNKRDICLFLKRLRKRFGSGIRFFQCGEYGSLFQRPHHHAIIFGFDFPDKKLWFINHGVKLYRSQILEELWPFGYCTIGSVTFESAAYVARYIIKKVNGDRAKSHYNGRLPEFITMSRRPGIAHDWIQEFSTDVYPGDRCVVRPGFVARPPKYYDKIFDLTNHEVFSKIKNRRILKAKESEDNCLYRLAAREGVQKARMEKLVRKFENGSV
nr:MAG: replication initiator protein [Microvirus sp.]